MALLVRSPEERFWAKVVRSPECWEWQGGKDRDGYGFFDCRTRETARAHRYSWILANGPIPAGKQILHRCDNPPCVRPDHLFAGTNQDNMDDKVRKGRQGRSLGARNGMHTHPETRHIGEQNFNAKLNDQSVREIRALWQARELTQPQIAARYGVTSRLISCVVLRKIWKHVA